MLETASLTEMSLVALGFQWSDNGLWLVWGFTSISICWCFWREFELDDMIEEETLVGETGERLLWELEQEEKVLAQHKLCSEPDTEPQFEWEGDSAECGALYVQTIRSVFGDPFSETWQTHFSCHYNSHLIYKL